MLAEYKPLLLLASWIVLGASVGFVAMHTIVGMLKGVRTIWPVAFLATITGWLAAGLPGVLIGLSVSALLGWVVAQVS